MKIPPLNLAEYFNSILTELHAAEKKYVKCFNNITDTALTDELSKALSPDETAIEDHISRLGQVMELQKLKTSRITSSLDDELLNTSKDLCGFIKQKSILKDIQLVHYTQLILQSKILRYESLYNIAKVLKMEKAALLFEQSKKDNQNTNAYLTQIAENILYPASYHSS